MRYPDVLDASRVGSYTALTNAGGGFVWDDVLEYRVWLHPENVAPDEEDRSDYYYAFASFEEALAFSEQTEDAEEPLALVLQHEYISEPEHWAIHSH